MKSQSRWNRYQGQVVCYGVRITHSVFLFPSFGPFPNATEAGAAVDQLRARYPGAEIVFSQIVGHVLLDEDNEALDVRYEEFHWQLELAVGGLVPFSVVETIEVSPREVTPVYAQGIAARMGCAAEEIVVLPGWADSGKVWIVYRRHLQTEDPAKAETKALWLQRELIQQGRVSDTGTICAMVYPLSVPTQNEAL